MTISLNSLLCWACCLFVLIQTPYTAFAQTKYNLENFNYLTKNAEEGKSYYFKKVTANTPNAVHEPVGYQIKLIPPRFREYYDTIVIAPALNGNLDTTNYFVQTEVLILREPAYHWQKAEISKLCVPGAKSGTAGICLYKVQEKHDIVHKRFYPYKNIMDTSNTDFVIPAEIKVVKRYEQLEHTKISHHPLNEQLELKSGEKVVVVTEGYYQQWQEAVCPFGVFNDPDVRKIQQALLKEGYKLKETGDYDEPTKSALLQFQLDHQLPDTGINQPTLQRLGIQPEVLIKIVD